MEAFFIVVFAAWFALSAIWQFPIVRDRVQVLTPAARLRLFPIYTFFAPNPGIADYHMLVRDARDDGSISGWTEVEIVRARHVLHFIWNPNKRRQKLVADALSEVKQIYSLQQQANESAEIASARLRLSQGYMILQNLASSAAPQEGAALRQFIITECILISGGRELVPIFRSPFHVLS